MQAEVLHGVMGHATPDRVPHVPVHVDETRHRGSVLRVDDLRIISLDAGSDRSNRPVLDVDVTERQIPNPRIHADHLRAAEKKLTGCHPRGPYKCLGAWMGA